MAAVETSFQQYDAAANVIYVTFPVVHLETQTEIREHFDRVVAYRLAGTAKYVIGDVQRRPLVHHRNVDERRRRRNIAHRFHDHGAEYGELRRVGQRRTRVADHR